MVKPAYERRNAPGPGLSGGVPANGFSALDDTMSRLRKIKSLVASPIGDARRKL
jgi:hypothetical protein